MRRFFFISGLLTATLFQGIVSAQAQEQPNVDCANAETQTDMTICANKDYEAADTELNAVYKKAMAAMKNADKDLAEIDANYPGAVDALKKAQRAWIDYRDGQCELAGFEARGASLEPMLVSVCLAGLTKKRSEELKGFTEGFGN
ncbi:lysozyme inhibitor LprI family protein [Rhizobium sp. Root483D2]|uniref:lysozyme inhibitor LprI family protein n=1 Tax=Rhizobium sp. Root483D2 TaxID=1736545 RepID=UPI0009EA49A9|nr:lysozyme inhibitor LprI family protein [Rhizobium sp. Root483D2]